MIGEWSELVLALSEFITEKFPPIYYGHIFSFYIILSWWFVLLKFSISVTQGDSSTVFLCSIENDFNAMLILSPRKQNIP